MCVHNAPLFLEDAMKDHISLYKAYNNPYRSTDPPISTLLDVVRYLPAMLVERSKR